MYIFSKQRIDKYLIYITITTERSEGAVMLQIAICEDNPQHRKKIHDIIQKALFAKTDMMQLHGLSVLHVNALPTLVMPRNFGR